MKIRSLEEVSKDLERIMAVSHPGNMQLQISDKCILHYAECITDYDKDDNEVLTGLLDCSFSFYGEQIYATLKKDEDDCFEVVFAEGNLLSSFDDFIEDEDNHEVLKAIWNTVSEWHLS